MGEHIDNRTPARKKLKEHDQNARRARVTFKNYLRELDDEFEASLQALDLDDFDLKDDNTAK